MKSLFILIFAAMLQACAVVPAVHSSGGVVVRTTGPYGAHYPVYGYGHVYSSPVKDIRVQTKEDEHGLVSFRVSESGLTEPEVDWLLQQVDDHKALCKSGGEMKKFERTSNVRANPYSTTRRGRGDTTLRVEYVCNRGSEWTSTHSRGSRPH
jgi:hypothetical protein